MNTIKRKRTKKEPKKQHLMAEKLQKIKHAMPLIVSVGFLLYVAITEFFPIFSSDTTNDTTSFFLQTMGLLVLCGLFYTWRIKTPTSYSLYEKEDSPAVIRVKGANDKVYRGVLFAFFVVFYIWMLWKITTRKPLLIALFIVTIVFFTYSFIKDYRNTFYALEIQNGSIYFFYKGTLKATIPLKHIHHISFIFGREGIGTKLYPRLQVYNSEGECVLRMVVSLKNYRLLKAFFSKKHIKIMEDYTRTKIRNR